MGKLYLAGKAPLLVGDMVVNFGDILPELAKALHAEIWAGIHT